jgi:hypothetical protein
MKRNPWRRQWQETLEEDYYNKKPKKKKGAESKGEEPYFGKGRRSSPRQKKNQTLVASLSSPGWCSPQQHQTTPFSSQPLPAKLRQHHPHSLKKEENETFREGKRINYCSNNKKFPPSTPATTTPADQQCNLFFSSTSSSFMQYYEPSNMHSSNNIRFWNHEQ